MGAGCEWGCAVGHDDGRRPFGFEDLEVHEAARAFRKRVYRLARLLPPEGKFGLQA